MRVFLLSFGGKIAAAFFVAICIALGFGPDRWAKVVLGLDPSLIGRTAFITLAVLVSCTTIAPYLKQRKGRPILGPVIVASAAILACVGGLIWFVESLGTTKETNSGNGPKRPQTSLPTSEKQQDSASTTAEPRSKAVAGDEVGQVRVIFDRTNGRAAVIDQTSNVKIATVERDPSAIAMVGTVVIKVAFYTNVGPVIVQVTEVGNTMSSSIPKFAVVENSERFISLRIDPTSFANLIVVDSHEFRISFFRKKEGLVQPQSSKNKIGSIEGDEGGIARTQKGDDSIVRAKLHILQAFFDCLDNDAVAIYRTGSDFWGAWNGPDNAGSPQGFLDFIVKVQARLRIFHEKIESIAVNNQRYPDVAQSHTFWYNNSLHEKNNLLRSELERMIELHPGDNRAVLLLNNRFVEEWYAALNDFSNWISEKKQYISDRQKQLEAL